METLPEQVYTDLKAQLPALTDALKQGIEYGGDLFHRFIVYDIAWQSAEIVLMLIASFVLIKFCIAATKQIPDRDSFVYKTDLDVVVYFGDLFCLLAVIFFFCSTVLDLQIIAKDIFIPELRVIEIISNLNAQ